MSRSGVDAPWTAEELDMIRREYPSCSSRSQVIDLAERLGRSVDAVYKVAARRLGLATARTWTLEQDNLLREGWGKTKTQVLARTIGRSPSALKQRARKLGLDCERLYTKEEKQIVRSMYGTHTASQIAERIHGTTKAVTLIYRLAHNLGLRKCGRWSPEEMEAVRAARAEGGTDSDIARRLGKTREQITHIRNRLGLPRDAAAILESGRRAVKKQQERLGVKSGGELRALGYRRYAAACGWPEDLPPRAVQILNILAEHGPKTASELADAIGLKAKRNTADGHRMYLTCASRSNLVRGHGTYTGLLISKGLVHREQRYVTGRGKGKNRLPCLYILTPAAIQIREECLERAQREKRDGSTAATEAELQPTAAG
jgi:transposase-like protein